MSNLPDFAASDKLSLPKTGAPVRYGQYFGFEGFITVDAEWTPLFRTSGTLWKPVVNTAELIILGLVGDAEAQLVLDTLAGGFAAIACRRQNLEVQ